MNPRILKKLSKRVVAIGVPRGLSVDLCDADNYTEYAPRGASRKPSHREKPWSSDPYQDGKQRLGDMYSLKGTPWLCWSSCTMDGTEYEGRIAWHWMSEDVRGDIEHEALDWSHPSVENGDWPPFKDGIKPKYPRNTWEMLRAIEAKHSKPNVVGERQHA